MSRSGRVAMLVLAIMVLGAVAAPWLAPTDPRTQHDLSRIWQAPSDALKSPSRSSGSRMLFRSSAMAPRLSRPSSTILIGGMRTPSW